MTSEPISDRPEPDLLEARGLEKTFVSGSRKVHAVRGVDLTVASGETVALVGESGSGKSTVARMIVRLIPATAGEIRFQGRDLLRLPSRELRGARKSIQMVFQDPMASLNPRMSVGAIVAEPLIIHRISRGKELKARVADLLMSVGLSIDSCARYPHELSGGQRQRVGIARALALEPSLIVADEPVSALDVSVRAQIVNLLREFQTRRRLAYLFIAHDLALIRQISHRIAVMYRGRIVESAETRELFELPLHPYTRRLISAIPSLHSVGRSAAKTGGVRLTGELEETGPLLEVRPGHWLATGASD